MAEVKNDAAVKNSQTEDVREYLELLKELTDTEMNVPSLLRMDMLRIQNKSLL